MPRLAKKMPKVLKLMAKKKPDPEQANINKYEKMEGMIKLKMDSGFMSFFNSHNKKYFMFADSGRIWVYCENKPKNFTGKPIYTVYTRNISEIKNKGKGIWLVYTI